MVPFRREEQASEATFTNQTKIAIALVVAYLALVAAVSVWMVWS